MSLTVPLLRPEQRWECPNCMTTAVTHESRPHTEFHFCRGLVGMWAPMVPAGTRAKVVAHEREDYVGKDLVQTNGEGRPVMAVVVTRDEGEDRTVYAPCAQLTGEVAEALLAQYSGRQ